MTTLREAIQWQHIPIGAGAAVRQIELAIGSVGNSKPTALITAGIHGDEGPWGAWAIHKLLDGVSVSDLRGSIRVVPVANPLAMEADLRNATLDQLDLNRVFPGNSDGSYTERIAAALVTHALDGVDIVIDIHGGGSWCVNAFVFQFADGEVLSQAIGAPLLAPGIERSVTLTGYARTALNAMVTGIEMGGRSQLEQQWADRIAAGLRRALGATGIIAPVAEPASVAIPVKPSMVLRPSQGGVFVPELRAESVGKVVPGGTVLGHLLDPVTFGVVETFRAPFEQTAIMLLRPTVARIEGGAMTYVVAEPLA
jgi:predicted deacylase